MTTHEEALAHFGVKGMRWGVRKQSKYGTPNPSSAKRRAGQVAVSVGKGTLKAIGKTIVVGAKAAVAVAGVATVATVAAMLQDPDVQNNISVGKDMAKLSLDESGAISMSNIDKAKAYTNVYTRDIENRIND